MVISHQSHPLNIALSFDSLLYSSISPFLSKMICMYVCMYVYRVSWRNAQWNWKRNRKAHHYLIENRILFWFKFIRNLPKIGKRRWKYTGLIFNIFSKGHFDLICHFDGFFFVFLSQCIHLYLEKNSLHDHIISIVHILQTDSYIVW